MKVQAVALLERGVTDWFQIEYTPSDANLPFTPPEAVFLKKPVARVSAVAPDKRVEGTLHINAVLIFDHEPSWGPRLLVYRERDRRFEEASRLKLV